MGRFAFVNDAALSLAPGTRLVKAAEYIAWAEGEAVLAEARRRAGALLAEAEAEAEARKEAGYREGLRRGKAASSRYMLGMVGKSRELLRENEDKLVAMVIAVLRKILGEMDDTEVVVRMIRQAMAVVGRENQVTVLVAPAKVEAVKRNLDAIIRPFPRIGTVTVAGDPSLAGGHCVLETRMGRVESSLEDQLETITGALKDMLPDRRERLEKDLRAIEMELSAALSHPPGEAGARLQDPRPPGGSP